VTIGDVRRQDKGGEKRKGLQKIRCCLIHPVCEAAQRWNRLVAAAGRPPITILKTDQMRSRYEMHKAKDDTRNEEL
jgi:hypothetical protein